MAVSGWGYSRVLGLGYRYGYGYQARDLTLNLKTRTRDPTAETRDPKTPSPATRYPPAGCERLQVPIRQGETGNRKVSFGF